MRVVTPAATILDTVTHHATAKPFGIAFADMLTGYELSWSGYLVRANTLASDITDRVVTERERVALLVPDGIAAHVTFLASEIAGVVALGIGSKSGDREILHLLERTDARLIVTTARDAERLRRISPVAVLVLDESTAIAPAAGTRMARSPFTLDELWFLNSTSGTTGLPKVVRHHQRRWCEFHALAVDAGRLTTADVFGSLVPAPFGFGLWTSHFTPTLIGSPCVVADRFDAAATLAAIEQHRITVLAAVPTQLALLMSNDAFGERDLSSLRVVFTGGEMLPYERGVEFEDRTGAVLLQFYGSNETGALSRTTLDDSRDVRLRTAGRLIAGMQVRLVDDNDLDVSSTGGPAVPCCKGPLLSLGYDADDAANAALYTRDGWMKMGDLVTISPASEFPTADDAVLTVVGRTADLIIRGGKNISAPQVEEETSTHPAIALVAVAAVADPVFGERVCAYAVLKDGTSLTLAELTEHLGQRGVGKDLWPELLVIVEGDLPRNAGGKVAKHALGALRR